MTCYHPNQAHVAGIKPDGKKIIRFGLPKKPDQESFLLPCSQCIGCRLDYSIQWAARCMHENQMHDNSCFITLTYDEEHLPAWGTLVPHHFTNFMKKLRHAVDPLRIRYFMGAEYGQDKGHRPHYHAIIFGYDFPDKEVFRECEGIYTYYSPLLEKIWGKGFCTTGEVTLESCAYTARYIMKKYKVSDASPETIKEDHNAYYERVCPITGEIRQLEPEYARMSRGGDNKGLGYEWYKTYSGDIFPYDTTIYRGKKIKTPRYYENLLRSTDLLTFENVKAERKKKAALHLADQTPRRLRDRETVKIASMQNIYRTLHNEN
ncbi:replication initiator protein [Microviridae sp.]|nr:replication initiator protein [Microviridae sp.]